MFSEMVINRQTQHRNATLTRIFIGLDENLKQPAASTRARLSQTQKLRHVDDNMENFQKIRQAFHANKIEKRIIPGLFIENINKTTLNKIIKSGRFMVSFASWV